MTRYTASLIATLAFALAVIIGAVTVLGAAPATFALVVAACPVAYVSAKELWIMVTRA